MQAKIGPSLWSVNQKSRQLGAGRHDRLLSSDCMVGVTVARYPRNCRVDGEETISAEQGMSGLIPVQREPQQSSKQ